MADVHYRYISKRHNKASQEQGNYGKIKRGFLSIGLPNRLASEYSKLVPIDDEVKKAEEEWRKKLRDNLRNPKSQSAETIDEDDNSVCDFSNPADKYYKRHGFDIYYYLGFPRNKEFNEMVLAGMAQEKWYEEHFGEED
nr:hypothetical protein [Butyrivibrio sp. WCE2006]